MDPTRRFSDRVVDYVRYRPGYPRELIATLVEAGQLDATDVIADVGSGTGKLAELFLEFGNRVIGVEPNRAMREAGDQILADRSAFESVDGRAEETSLGDDSVNLVAAAQAFHWFDPPAARREFVRILRPGGRVLLVWNDRRIDATEFSKKYEALLETYGTDYIEINHRKVDENAIAAFFDSVPFDQATLANRQDLDWSGLRGRMLSSSYVPAPGRPGHEEILSEAERLFRTHRQDGTVRLEYDTKLYFGRLVPTTRESANA